MQERVSTPSTENGRQVARRKLIRSAGLGGLGLALLGVGAACGGEKDESSSAEAGQPVTPRVQAYAIKLGEAKFLEEVDGKDELVAEGHRWEPAILVAFKGDKVVLEVKNPRKNIHSFQIPAFEVDTGVLIPRTGTKTVEFVANKAGVFEFGCGSKFDGAKQVCDPDHDFMVGHLVVLNA